MERNKIIAKSLKVIKKHQSDLQTAKEKISHSSKNNNDLMQKLTLQDHMYSYYIKLCENCDEETLNGFDPKKFDLMASNIKSTEVSGVIYADLNKAYDEHNKDINELTPILTSTGSINSTATAYVENILPEHIGNKPDVKKVKEKIQLDASLNSDIMYIKNQLGKINKDVLKDFNEFLNKFKIYDQSTSQYQDLIGLRSTVFYKLIKGETQKYFKNNHKVDTLKKFIFGNNNYNNKADSIIKLTNEYWNEISSYNKTGMSIKHGITTPDYVTNMYRRLIDILASLLRLKEEFFSL